MWIVTWYKKRQARRLLCEGLHLRPGTPDTLLVLLARDVLMNGKRHGEEPPAHLVEAVNLLRTR